MIHQYAEFIPLEFRRIFEHCSLQHGLSRILLWLMKKGRYIQKAGSQSEISFFLQRNISLSVDYRRSNREPGTKLLPAPLPKSQAIHLLSLMAAPCLRVPDTLQFSCCKFANSLAFTTHARSKMLLLWEKRTCLLPGTLLKSGKGERVAAHILPISSRKARDDQDLVKFPVGGGAAISFCIVFY